jgi:anti-sigma regulatory factor (Ser/Thr protein kinase)
MFEELSLHLLDVAMNALAAGARTIEIAVCESRRHDWLVLRVRDDGRGMDPAQLRAALDQGRSTKDHRRKPIGLGLALLRQTSEMCGGHCRVRSAPGRGTTVTASMRWSHVDRPPLGDLPATVLALCAADPAVDVRLRYRSDETRFHFSSRQARQELSPDNKAALSPTEPPASHRHGLEAPRTASPSPTGPLSESRGHCLTAASGWLSITTLL